MFHLPFKPGYLAQYNAESWSWKNVVSLSSFMLILFFFLAFSKGSDCIVILSYVSLLV